MTTTVRSWSATLVGVAFVCVTAWVLLEDVFRHGAPLNTRHVMTLAILTLTVFSGLWWWPEVKALRLVNAAFCTVLFLGGTATCVLMAAGRNAEAVSTKALVAVASNTDRDRAAKDRDEAKARYQAALTAEASECSTGSGEKCQAKRITRQLRREDYDAAEKALREQKPEQIANADIKAMALLISKLPWVTASTEAIEALLQLVVPFLQSLFCELGSIAGFSIGLHGSSARKTVRITPKPVEELFASATPFVPTPVMHRPEMSTNRSPRTVRVYNPDAVDRETALADLLPYIRQHQRVPSQEFLRKRWRLRSKGTVSDWLRAWEDEGLICRHIEGREKITSAPPEPL